jgi:hypothetical protein
MKTFLMIYNSRTRELLDEYEEFNDPLGAFNTWYFEGIMDTSFEDLKEVIVFYFVGSKKIKERKSGFLDYNKETGNMNVNDYPLYHILYDDDFNTIYHYSQKISWCDYSNSYFLSIKNDVKFTEFDEDIDDFLVPLEVLIPPLELFTSSNVEYHIFYKERGRIHLRFEHRQLLLNSFYERCELCGNDVLLDIEEMGRGEFSCKFCSNNQ